jgi:hypothetical protein
MVWIEKLKKESKKKEGKGEIKDTSHVYGTVVEYKLVQYTRLVNKARGADNDATGVWSNV